MAEAIAGPRKDKAERWPRALHDKAPTFDLLQTRVNAVSENLFKLFVTEFSTLLRVKLQQTQSKLRGKCMEGGHFGKQASPVQYIGAIQMRAPSGRFAPLDRQDVDFTRRWVFPQPKEAQ